MTRCDKDISELFLYCANYVTVTSNKLLSKQQVIDIAAGFTSAEGASAGLQDAALQVTEGLISQGFNP